MGRSVRDLRGSPVGVQAGPHAAPPARSLARAGHQPSLHAAGHRLEQPARLGDIPARGRPGRGGREPRQDDDAEGEPEPGVAPRGDGDGDEETIYSEGFFDVRWNASPIPDVTLLAGAAALSTPACEGPDIDPSGCTKPEILTAGLMPLRAPQFDTASGYALHVNKPRPGGLSTSPQAAAGEAPFWSTIQLHGCYRFPNVAFYRLLYSYEGNAEVPFVGLSWWAPRVGPGAPFHRRVGPADSRNRCSLPSRKTSTLV